MAMLTAEPTTSVRDSSGHGEGEFHIDTFEVTTDGDGHAELDRLVDTLGHAHLSATATDPQGKTSEFSPLLGVTGLTCTVTNEEAGGPGSLADCVNQTFVNGASTVDTIIIDVATTGDIDLPPTGCVPGPPNLIYDATTQQGWGTSPGDKPCDRTWNIEVRIGEGPCGLWPGANNAYIGFTMGSVVLTEDSPGVSFEWVRTDGRVLIDGNDFLLKDSRVSSTGGVGLDTIADATTAEKACVAGAILANRFNDLVADSARILESEVQGWFGTLGGEGNRSLGTAFQNPSSSILDLDHGTDGVTLGGTAGTPQQPDIDSAFTVEFETRSSTRGPASFTRVRCTHQAEPETDYRIELFAGDSCAVHGHGPMQRFLGGIDVTTDEAGFADCTADLAAETFPGEIVVATATGPDGTSEPTACVEVETGDASGIFADGFESGDIGRWSP